MGQILRDNFPYLEEAHFKSEELKMCVKLESSSPSTSSGGKRKLSQLDLKLCEQTTTMEKTYLEEIHLVGKRIMSLVRWMEANVQRCW